MSRSSRRTFTARAASSMSMSSDSVSSTSTSALGRTAPLAFGCAWKHEAWDRVRWVLPQLGTVVFCASHRAGQQDRRRESSADKCECRVAGTDDAVGQHGDAVRRDGVERGRRPAAAGHAASRTASKPELASRYPTPIRPICRRYGSSGRRQRTCRNLARFRGSSPILLTPRADHTCVPAVRPTAAAAFCGAAYRLACDPSQPPAQR